jgi:lipopolysaccharide transport system ATP-binding protein
MSSSETGSSPPAIEAVGLGKQYRLGEQLNFLAGLGRLAMRKNDRPPPRAEFLALENVTFRIDAGECIGVVGTNGSGKSTLLQILAGITLPTSGKMVVHGHVMSLLAVGTGFHPELTGRENILLFGTILGIPRTAILDRVDDVAAFAELESHLDTPAKRYSDGMLARLSFAIAMIFPSDIHVFDEVLAVVDGEFRDRCLEEIRRLVGEGRTVLFVSHSQEQVRALCDRTLWLDRGRLRALAATDGVLDDYSKLVGPGRALKAS